MSPTSLLPPLVSCRLFLGSFPHYARFLTSSLPPLLRAVRVGSEGRMTETPERNVREKWEECEEVRRLGGYFPSLAVFSCLILGVTRLSTFLFLHLPSWTRIGRTERGRDEWDGRWEECREASGHGTVSLVVSRLFSLHTRSSYSHLLPVGTRRETTSVTREVTRRVTDMEAGWEGSSLILHSVPPSQLMRFLLEKSSIISCV